MTSSTPTSAPMLQIKAPLTHNPPSKYTPNLLPCSQTHNGPVNATERYWNPSTDDDGTRTAFFRGRRLRGREVVLPANYQGVMLQKTGTVRTENIAESEDEQKQDVQRQEDEDDELDQDDLIEVETVEQAGTFDRVLLWGHDAVPVAGEDAYSKGIEEWITLAEAMHAYPHAETTGSSS